ncbi:MAG: hypothetical protein QXX19_00410 [Candidatus Caldarchaeum sp.]
MRRKLTEQDDEMSLSSKLEDAVKRYHTTAVVLAILVHFFIFITAILVIVVLKQPLVVFIATHATLQTAAVLNALFGHRIYRKYLTTRLARNIRIS